MQIFFMYDVILVIIVFEMILQNTKASYFNRYLHCDL